MLNLGAKYLLVTTSLSPVLGAVAIGQYECKAPWPYWVIPLVIALLLILICWIILGKVSRKAQNELFRIEEFERKDQEVLIFLFIYLLPFVRSPNPSFASEWLMSIYVLGIIVVAVAHADAFHFNPVMRCLGYRFYSAKNQHGISSLLISNRNLRRIGEELITVKLAWNVYLHKGEPDA